MNTDKEIEQSHKLDEAIKHRNRLEILFLKSEEGNAIQNKNAVFAYKSACGKHMMRLDSYLADYREWLIENKFVKEI